MGKCLSTTNNKEQQYQSVSNKTTTEETQSPIAHHGVNHGKNVLDTFRPTNGQEYHATETTLMTAAAFGEGEEGRDTVSELVALGIANGAECREALTVANGDINAAVEWLFNQPNITHNIDNNTQINECKSNNLNDLQKWCLNNGFTLDLYNRLAQPPMYIDNLQKLKYLTSDNDINDLVQELGLRFGKKVVFVQAMKQLTQEKVIESTDIKSNIEAKEAEIEILSCNRCKETFIEADWNKQNVIMEKGLYYTHLLCPSLNVNKKHKSAPKRKRKKNPPPKKKSSKNRAKHLQSVSYNTSIKFAPNGALTQSEINGECHVRESMIPYRTLHDSNFLKLYDKTKRVPTYYDIVNCLPKDLIDDFKECYKSMCRKYKSKESMDDIIGRACVQAWTHEDNQFTASKFYCKLNAALLSDHSELLKQWMFLIRGLNRFLVDTRPKKNIVCYRKSDLSQQQFYRIKVGEKYRIAMYTATSTDREFVKKWNRNSGEFYWIFKVPKGCYNACCIAEYSYHGEESEVLMPPYSTIEIVSKHAGYITANVLDNKQCSMSLATIVS